MIIGYQGYPYSNAYYAAERIANRLKFKNITYKPLTSATRVIRNLSKGKVDYGLVTLGNNIGGPVKETSDVLETIFYEDIIREYLPVHHCLFKRPDAEDIKHIAGHEEALKQVKDTCARLLPGVDFYSVEDTTIAAQLLRENKFKSDTAILCRKEAGVAYNLQLMFENLEDREDNTTEFMLIKFKGNKKEDNSINIDGMTFSINI